MSALPVGAELNVPIVDGDGMGRAYPTMYHGTCFRLYWQD